MRPLPDKKNDPLKELESLTRTALYESYEVSYALTEALLAVMAAKGLTRASVARELDVSPSYLAPVFGATPKLNIRKLLEVCEVLKVDPWALLVAVGQRGPSKVVPWTQDEMEAIATRPRGIKVAR